MSESIREQIIDFMGARAAQILKSRGFNSNVGNNVKTAFNIPIGYREIPAVSVFPGVEEETGNYDTQKRVMPVRIIAVDKIGTLKPWKAAERLKADVEEAFTGTLVSITFTSGSQEIQPGDSIVGDISGFTAWVESVQVDSGTWGGGDAAGSITVRRLVTLMSSSETISIGSDSNVATITNAISHQRPSEVCTGGLANSIIFDTGGVEGYPEEGQKSIACETIFNVEYKVTYGNPYHQKS